MQTDDLYALFEDCHSKGAERFGVDWLSANIAAKSAAERMDIDPSTLEMKTLLSLASYHFLDWMYSATSKETEKL